MRDLRLVQEESGLLGVVAELLATTKRFGSASLANSAAEMLDAMADALSSSPWTFRQDSILSREERREVLGGVVVAVENQHCWEATLDPDSDVVEFVHEVGEGDSLDTWVFRNERLGETMSIAELLFRVMAQEWIYSVDRRELACTELDGALEPFVMLRSRAIADVGGFPTLIAGPGWLGTGRASGVRISLLDASTPVPFDLGIDWRERVWQPATVSDIDLWDPWREAKLARIQEFRTESWIPVAPSPGQDVVEPAIEGEA